MGRWFGRRFLPPVEAVGRGQYVVRLGEDELGLVSDLVHQLRDLLVRGDPDDERVRRLFPVAYHDDPERDAEYQRLMREELVASRLAAIELLDRVLLSPADQPANESEQTRQTILDEEQVTALMHSVNSLRLVLGTLLDVGEDEDPTVLAEDHPHLGEHHLYGWLSWLLEWTVRALSAGR